MRFRTGLLRVGLLLGVASGLLQVAQPAAAQTPPDQPVRLPGHVLDVLRQATQQPVAPRAVASTPVTVTVVLNHTNEAAFDAFLAAVEDPHSASFHHFATGTDLAARFGPSLTAYDAVVAYLQKSGLTLIEGSASRLTITVRGSRDQMEHAFGVQLHDFELDGRSFFASDVDPALPATIAPFVQSVSGLDNLARPQPHTARVLASAAANLAPAPYAPSSIGTAYNFAGAGSGINGAGQKVALLEYDSFTMSDVTNWIAYEGLPAALANNVSVRSMGGAITQSTGGASEILLDIDTVLGLAPGASIAVYEAPNDGSVSWATMFSTMVNEGATVISNSWGDCESYVAASVLDGIDATLKDGAARGVTAFSASGDSGNVCNGSVAGSAGVPDDAPHGVSVGGTTLSVNSGNSYAGESWWNNSGGGAGGFSVSSHFSRPSYQDPFSSNSGRSEPDVAADADPHTGIQICQATASGSGCPNGYLWGGTSMAAPEWAAGVALLNQKLGHTTGNLNQALYAKAGGAGFHQPGNMSAPSNDFAHLGIGSFNLGALVTAMGTSVPTGGQPGISTPVPGTTLSGSTVTFSWAPVPGADAYWVSVGKSAYGGQYGDSGSLSGTSYTVSGLPADSSTVHVLFYWHAGGAWHNAADATYTAAGAGAVTPIPAVITSPTPGSTLGGSTVTFRWSAATGADAYQLYAGRTVNGTEYANSGSLSSSTSSYAVTTLPTDGSTVHVLLQWHAGGLWQSAAAVTYTAARPVQTTPAAITSPTPGSTLGGSTVTFQWSAASGADAYQLYAGKQLNGTEYANSGSLSGSTTSFTVNTLPADSSTVHVLLQWHSGGVWQSAADVTYTAAAPTPASTGPGISTPVPGTTLAGSTVTFSWAAVAGADAYWVSVGKTRYGAQYADSGSLSGTSYTVSGLPTDGSSVHVLFYWHTGGAWQNAADVTYSAAAGGVIATPAAITSPTPGSTLAGSTVTFQWSAASNADMYQIYAGKQLNGSEYANSGQLSGATLSFAVSTLPTDGSTVHVLLQWHTSAGWRSAADVTYTAAQAAQNSTAAITSPAPRSMLAGSTVTFRWSTATGADAYQVSVGKTLNGVEYGSSGSLSGSTTSYTTTRLPADGSTVHVLLQWHSGGVWQSAADVTYTAASPASTGPGINTPSPGTTLSGSTVTFGWAAVTGADAYWVSVGKTLYGGQYGDSGSLSGISYTVSGLPTDSSTVHVRFYWHAGGAWQTAADVTYTAAPPP